MRVAITKNIFALPACKARFHELIADGHTIPISGAPITPNYPNIDLRGAAGYHSHR